VSYSWYLWHWPAIVAYRLYTFNELTWPSRTALAAGTFVLAVLSWRFVEGPLRRFPLPHRSWVVSFAAATSAAVVALGLLVQPFSRLVHPADATTQAFLRQAGVVHATDNRKRTCFIATGYNLEPFDVAACATPKPGKRNVLVLGDSHAADLWYGLSRRLPEAEVLQATASGCRPVLPLTGHPLCVGVLQPELTRLADHPVDALVVSARWQVADLPRLASTLAAYRKLAPEVVVVGPSPEWRGDLPSLLARARDTGDSGLLDRRLERRVLALDAKMRAVVSGTGATYVSLVDELCTGTSCRALAAPALPMAFDYGHFTEAGSVIATAGIAEALSVPPI
jgi:hypothetical protein